MATRRRISRGDRAQYEFFVTTVEQQRMRPLPESELARIRDGLASPDECIRARAVRAVCPCRMPWPVFLQFRKTVARLRRDASPHVRANALHVEVDARTVREREAIVAYLAERDEQAAEVQRRKGRSARGGA